MALPIDGDGAYEHVFLEHRHQQKRARAPDVDQRSKWRKASDVSRLCRGVEDVNYLFGARESGNRKVRLGSHDPIAWELVDEVKWHAMQCDTAESVALHKPHHAILRLADARRIRQHRVEHRLELTGRRANDTENLGHRRLLLQGFAELAAARLHLLEQAHVLNRDDRLVGEGLEQLDLSSGKASSLYFRHGDRADRLAVLQHRDSHDAAVANDKGATRVLVFRVCLNVRNFLDGAAQDAASGGTGRRRRGA